MALIQAKCSLSQLTARLGGLFCDDERIVKLNLYTRGVKRDPSTFDKSELDTLIAQDKFIGALEFFSEEDNYGDPSYTESTAGDRYKNNDGSVRFSFMFMRKGNCFHNQLYKLDRSENYSVTFITESGKELCKLTKDGKYAGFDSNLFVDNKKLKFGAEGGGSTLLVDILSYELKDWNLRAVMVEADDFDFREIAPIAELNLDVPNLVAGSTTTAVKVTTTCSDAEVAGLTTSANWKMLVNGVKTSITSVSAVNGTYTFTHPALVAGQKIQFITDVAGYPVYVLDSNYYVGESQEEVVA
jgi:hypothetical protein